MYNIDVSSTVLKSRPEELKHPVSSLDHGEHMVNTALKGHPQLAADHLLNTEMRGKLVEVLSSIIRRLNLEFVKNKPTTDEDEEKETEKILARQRAYEVMIETAANLVGTEARRVGFSEKEVNEALKRIVYTLEKWERLEKQEGAETSVAKAVVDKILLDMKKVMRGKSMIAKMSEEIEKELVE